MKKNILGKTGLEVTCLGFGGIPIQRLTEQEAIDVIKELKNQGINFIDTAIGYTVSEGYIGKALKEVGRDSFYIATKAMGYTYDTMKAFIEQSLRQLDVEYIDLYQIHNVSKQEQFDNVISENGAFKALLEAKEKGLIKHIGVTSHNITMVEKFLDYDIIETIQFPFNVVEQQAVEVFKKAKERNVGVLSMKPLAGGAINDGALAIKYILSKEYIDVAIPGMNTIEQVKENVSVIDDIKLTEEDNKKIEKIKEELSGNFCRRCEYCLPCPNQVNIPQNFLLEGYYTRYNLKEWALERYEGLGNGKASECIECGICEEKCPYNLPISSMLKNVCDKLEKL